MSSEYTKNLSEPWFSLIKLGIKKCEGRLKKGDFAEI
jgi:ASC-1-like (ASCH) protein